MSKTSDTNKILTEQEAEFCLMYVNATAPYAGDARRCYQATINPKAKEAEAQHLGLALLKEERVAERINELEALNAHDAASLKKKITATLVGVMDECAIIKVKDRYGKDIPAASMRAVSVNAAKELNSMYGIKEDIAHKISIDGTEGSGITFNINVPTPNKEEEDFCGDD